MLLNTDQRSWALVSAAVFGALTVGYVAYVNASPYGPSGGSWPGLFFGILGLLFMIVAGLLAARKKVRVRRIGSAQLWMRLHIWLSLLAVPCILFHSGFGLGGPLTTALMALFYIVIASGVFGLLLQQFVPGVMTRQVPLETIHFQIDHVVENLSADAYELVASVTGPLAEAAEEQQRITADDEVAKRIPGFWKPVARQRAAEAPQPRADELKNFYLSAVRPYLKSKGRRQAAPDFRTMILAAPEDWVGKLEKLQAMCEEARQLGVQQRLHSLLHNWLFIHAPLSFAMFVLAAVHAVLALRY